MPAPMAHGSSMARPGHLAARPRTRTSTAARNGCGRDRNGHIRARPRARKSRAEPGPGARASVRNSSDVGGLTYVARMRSDFSANPGRASALHELDRIRRAAIGLLVAGLLLAAVVQTALGTLTAVRSRGSDTVLDWTHFAWPRMPAADVVTAIGPGAAFIFALALTPPILDRAIGAVPNGSDSARARRTAVDAQRGWLVLLAGLLLAAGSGMAVLSGVAAWLMERDADTAGHLLTALLVEAGTAIAITAGATIDSSVSSDLIVREQIARRRADRQAWPCRWLRVGDADAVARAIQDPNVALCRIAWALNPGRAIAVQLLAGTLLHAVVFIAYVAIAEIRGGAGLVIPWNAELTQFVAVLTLFDFVWVVGLSVIAAAGGRRWLVGSLLLVVSAALPVAWVIGWLADPGGTGAAAISAVLVAGWSWWRCLRWWNPHTRLRLTVRRGTQLSSRLGDLGFGNLAGFVSVHLLGPAPSDDDANVLKTTTTGAN